LVSCSLAPPYRIRKGSKTPRLKAIRLVEISDNDRKIRSINTRKLPPLKAELILGGEKRIRKKLPIRQRDQQQKSFSANTYGFHYCVK
jgi:hypothetical protein